MATAKKPSKKPVAKSTKTTTATVKVSKPKKTVSRKKEMDITPSEIESGADTPRTKVITKKYLYAVVAVIAVVSLLFVASRLWVVAWVDNKPITKFELYGLMEKRDQGKTAEELIVQKLLISEGQKQKQAVTDAEIQAEVAKIEELQGGAASTLR